MKRIALVSLWCLMVHATIGAEPRSVSGIYPHLAMFNDSAECGTGAVVPWAGAVDDLWKLGKPRGVGGPWKDTAVKAGQPSDPYLMTGYDHKRVTLSHSGKQPVKLRLEADISGTGVWVTYREFSLEPGKPVEHVFPDAYAAYWVRAVADKETTATVMFRYE